jgi:hypothetical protein
MGTGPTAKTDDVLGISGDKEENMTEEHTEDYRDALEDLANSRGLSGAEELARRVVEADPDYSVRGVLEGNAGGLGEVLDEVLDPPPTEEERVRLVRAMVEGPKAKRARGLCPVPGCERPEAPRGYGCREHRRVFEAQADEEAWDLALSILTPWVEATRKIGSDELTSVMERALEEAERELNRVLDEREAAEAAL